MALNYKICANGDRAMTTVSMTTYGSPRQETNQSNFCDTQTTFQRYRITSSVPADDDLRIYYSYQWRVAYKYPASTNWSTWYIQSNSVMLPAGQTSVIIELKTYQFQCCTGDNQQDIRPYDSYETAQ